MNPNTANLLISIDNAYQIQIYRAATMGELLEALDKARRGVLSVILQPTPTDTLGQPPAPPAGGK